MSSPVFKSQRSSLVSASYRRPRKLVLPSLEIPVDSSSRQDDEEGIRVSPILWSQRARDKTQRTQEAAPWKKCKTDGNEMPEQLEAALHRTPGHLIHDDSFVENIDFEEIDSMCTSMESTPKRKVRSTVIKRFSSHKKVSSFAYSLRQTPQRAKTLLKFSASPSVSGKNRSGSGKNSEQTCGKQNGTSHYFNHKENNVNVKARTYHQSFYTEIRAVVESSCSSSSSEGPEGVNALKSIGNTIKQKKPPVEPQVEDGRLSPDMFGEATQSGRECLSESMDAVLTLIEDDYYNSSCDNQSKDGQGPVQESIHPAPKDTQLILSDNSVQAISRDHSSLQSTQRYSSLQASPKWHSSLQATPRQHSSLQATPRQHSSLKATPRQHSLLQATPRGHASLQASLRDQSFLLKSPDSQISFSSTLESQPLIGRLEDKLKEVSTSQVGSEVVQPVTERRAAAVAAALNEAVRSHTQDLQLGPFFGLPSSVALLLKQHRGISQLYGWQEESIKAGSGGDNLLICQPTSGGKTLVAEVLILQHILLRQRHAIFVLPYVALVQEKYNGC